MKLNISYPANGSQKIIEVDDERKLRPFMEKRMGTEVSIPPDLKIQYHPDESIHTCTHNTNDESNWLIGLSMIRSPPSPSATSSRATSSRLPVVTTSKVRLLPPLRMFWAWRTKMGYRVQWKTRLLTRLIYRFPHEAGWYVLTDHSWTHIPRLKAKKNSNTHR